MLPFLSSISRSRPAAFAGEFTDSAIYHQSRVTNQQPPCLPSRSFQQLTAIKLSNPLVLITIRTTGDGSSPRPSSSFPYILQVPYSLSPFVATDPKDPTVSPIIATLPKTLPASPLLATLTRPPGGRRVIPISGIVECGKTEERWCGPRRCQPKRVAAFRGLGGPNGPARRQLRRWIGKNPEELRRETATGARRHTSGETR